MSPDTQASFSYRHRAVTLDDWPSHGGRHVVHLDHPLTASLVCPNRTLAPVQLERLNALEAAGYRARQSCRTDWLLIRLARHFSPVPSGNVFNHPRYFCHLGDPVVIYHSDLSEDAIGSCLPVICRAISEQWDSGITYDVDPRFNFVWPERGVSYELRRTQNTRPPAWGPLGVKP